jgi:hypothetical protein
MMVIALEVLHHHCNIIIIINSIIIIDVIVVIIIAVVITVVGITSTITIIITKINRINHGKLRASFKAAHSALKLINW